MANGPSPLTENVPDTSVTEYVAPGVTEIPDVVNVPEPLFTPPLVNDQSLTSAYAGLAVTASVGASADARTTKSSIKISGSCERSEALLTVRIAQRYRATLLRLPQGKSGGPSLIQRCSISSVGA